MKKKLIHFSAHYLNLIAGIVIGFGLLDFNDNPYILVVGMILLFISYYFRFHYIERIVKDNKIRELTKDEILKKKLNILTKRRWFS